MVVIVSNADLASWNWKWYFLQFLTKELEFTYF